MSHSNRRAKQRSEERRSHAGLSSGQPEQFKAAAASLGDKTKVATDAGDKAKSIGSVVSEMARDVSSTLAETARDAATAVTEKTGELTSEFVHGAEDAACYLTNKADDISEDLTKMIRANPIRSLLVAVGVGFVIALSRPTNLSQLEWRF